MLRPVRRYSPYLGTPQWIVQVEDTTMTPVTPPGPHEDGTDPGPQPGTYVPLNPFVPTMLLATQRLLPLWLSAVGTLTYESSLLWKLLRSMASEFSNTLTQTQRFEGAAADNYSGDVLPRRAWMLQTSEHIDSLTVATDEGVRALREALSEYDFLEASDAVYMTDDSGLLIMRNLTLSEQLVNSGDKVFSPTGELLTDERIHVLSNGSWVEVPHIVNYFPQSGDGSLVLGATGCVNVRCHTQANLNDITGACITINGNIRHTPIPLDLWNLYDELALRADIDRISDETNSSVAARARHLFASVGADPLLKSLVEVLVRLDLVRSASWTGLTELEITDALPIQNIFVVGLPQVEHIVEDVLLPDPSKLYFHSAKRSWYGDGEVLINKAPLSLLCVTGANIANGIVSFSEEQTGLVEASYSIRNWTASCNGTRATIAPTPNTVPGNYVVVYTVGASITRLDSSMLSNASTEDIALLMQSLNPVRVGEALWANAAAWITDDMAQPKLSFVGEVLR